MYYPKITARIENARAAYLTTAFRVEQERQRNTLVEFQIEEPIDTAESAILSMGFENELSEKCVLRVLECNQINPHLFECLAVDPSFFIYQADYIFQGTRLTVDEALTKIATAFGFTFMNLSKKMIYKRHNLNFLSTVRNALDQIMSIWGLSDLRYHFDTLRQRLYLLPGKLDTAPFELDMTYFIEENPDNGPEFRVLPNMSPFTPVIWKGEEMVVDNVVFDGESDSMFLQLEAA